MLVLGVIEIAAFRHLNLIGKVGTVVFSSLLGMGLKTPLTNLVQAFKPRTTVHQY